MTKAVKLSSKESQFVPAMVSLKVNEDESKV